MKTTQLSKTISELTGMKVRELEERNSNGERSFYIISEKQTLTHSDLNHRFSL